MALAISERRTYAIVTDLTEAEVSQLHGLGPKAIDLIRLALAARGLTFSN